MKLYESIENSKKWWASTNSLKLVELINDINAKGNNPVLAGVELSEGTENSNNIDRLKKSNPGMIKFTAQGAFRGDQLVGWLDESDSIAYANIAGKTKNSADNIEFDENTRVSLQINAKKAKLKVSLTDGKPVINVMMSAEMMINSDGRCRFHRSGKPGQADQHLK
jgi:spore germination protein KC